MASSVPPLSGQTTLPTATVAYLTLTLPADRRRVRVAACSKPVFHYRLWVTAFTRQIRPRAAPFAQGAASSCWVRAAQLTFFASPITGVGIGMTRASDTCGERILPATTSHTVWPGRYLVQATRSHSTAGENLPAPQFSALFKLASCLQNIFSGQIGFRICRASATKAEWRRVRLARHYCHR